MENVITKIKSCGGERAYILYTLIGGLSSPYFDGTTWSYYKNSLFFLQYIRYLEGLNFYWWRDPTIAHRKPARSTALLYRQMILI